MSDASPDTCVVTQGTAQWMELAEVLGVAVTYATYNGEEVPVLDFEAVIARARSLAGVEAELLDLGKCLVAVCEAAGVPTSREGDAVALDYEALLARVRALAAGTSA